MRSDEPSLFIATFVMGLQRWYLMLAALLPCHKNPIASVATLTFLNMPDMSGAHACTRGLVIC